MGSILSSDLGFKKVTQNFLKENGFKKTTWGSPKQVVYNNGKRKLIFDKCQYCWELIADNFDDYYTGLIYYFPEKFDAYVAPFQNGRKKDTPKHPAGYVYITIDNYNANKWENMLKIDYESDINAAISICRKKIKNIRRSW